MKHDGEEHFLDDGKRPVLHRRGSDAGVHGEAGDRGESQLSSAPAGTRAGEWRVTYEDGASTSEHGFYSVI